MGKLDGRLALVTGASRGIGYATALALAREGAHIIAVARTIGGLEELDDAIKSATGGEGATLVPMDLTDMPAVDRLGGAINERWGKLDILVANAGILGTISPIGHVEAKVFNKVIDTNLTATWRLIRSVEPLLLKADAGRALVLTSAVAHTARAFWGPYAATKAALETLVRVWAEESEKTALRVNAVDPGATRTAIRARAYPGEDASTLPNPADVAAKLIPLCLPETDESGKLFRVRDNRFFSYREPV
ncbi:SDR family NAD(P)-dependent oxidoreductase [Pseudohoeflea coraliihabitans]|uniref:SDR family NAD(P)-dependent oxidoreductase n=1 Tax=Pseudohoeflea coraliihabitans TaxID=2860393 RepID=A0ABS6WR71_9HYPH|nr:SDR family NAD(P)-dependent oxidoreductase [Pseudohoeflea sp. DP4N28-3]MBW3097902.1 SDR family NAD(P)-dependent oxidoreductase [Pseudohoeflea sp. DP4N28-3]